MFHFNKTFVYFYIFVYLHIKEGNRCSRLLFRLSSEVLKFSHLGVRLFLEFFKGV
jgi:hypothetical protein